MGKTDAVDAPDPPDPVVVVVQWLGSDGQPKFSKMSLDSDAKSWTLNKFRTNVAGVLHVDHLQLPDFNDDMDEMTLSDLSIGITNVPILLDLAGAQPTSEVPAAAEAPEDEAEEAEAAAAPKEAPKGPPSFAARKALEDASEVKDGCWVVVSRRVFNMFQNVSKFHQSWIKV